MRCSEVSLVLFLTVLILGMSGTRVTTSVVQTRRRQVQYQHFDDYLTSMAADLGQETRSGHGSHRGSVDRVFRGGHTDLFATTDDEDVVEGSGQGEGTVRSRSNAVPTTTNLNILSYFRDVPREHWSCCMLGVLAGDKGFHCQAQFYAARIVLRNRNRSHNRRLPFHGRNRNPTYGKDIMYHFQGCVERRAAEFHKCCYAATLERMEIDRWRRYRDFVSRSRGH